MLRYLPGILLIQIVTLVLFWASAGADLQSLLLRAGLPSLLIAISTALWFANVGRLGAERTLAKLKFEHERENQNIRREAERTQANARQEAQKELFKQERSVQRKANLKVGLAFAAACGMGIFMVLVELMTLGLLTITTAGGALGGYLVRWRQSSSGRLFNRVPSGSTPQFPKEVKPALKVKADQPDEPLRLSGPNS